MLILLSKPRVRTLNNDAYLIRFDLYDEPGIIISGYRIVLHLSGAIIEKIFVAQINRVQWSACNSLDRIGNYLIKDGYDVSGLRGFFAEPNNYKYHCYGFEFYPDAGVCYGSVTSLKTIIDFFGGDDQFLFSGIDWIQAYLTKRSGFHAG